MEEGSLRCDANISLRPRGVAKLGTKVELKNMNTFRGVEKAIEYEIRRQTEVLSNGGTITQQTFLWDANAGCTIPMRDKESAHDYRYFPDPDLVPLVVEEDEVERHRASLPELPQARRERLVESMKLTPYAAEVLTDTRMVADYFETVVGTCADAPLVANWVMGEVLRVSKDKKVDVDRLKVTPARLAQLITKVKDGTVSTQAAKKVLALIEEQDRDPSVIIKEQGMEQVSDTSALEQIIDKVLADSPKEIARYKAGEVKLISFFVGQVMKASRGKGNPAEINRILAGKLS
jgi:aspartyl-tRNA(Asn)/glutamyl-tRNA(Gln) amidotransferase subunit B